MLLLLKIRPKQTPVLFSTHPCPCHWSNRFELQKYSATLLTANFFYVESNKLDGVAPLVAEPPQWNSPTRQKKTPICNPPLYIANAFEPIMDMPCTVQHSTVRSTFSNPIHNQMTKLVFRS